MESEDLWALLCDRVREEGHDLESWLALKALDLRRSDGFSTTRERISAHGRFLQSALPAMDAHGLHHVRLNQCGDQLVVTAEAAPRQRRFPTRTASEIPVLWNIWYR